MFPLFLEPFLRLAFRKEYFRCSVYFNVGRS